MIKVIINPSKKQISDFESFSSKNWGKHAHDESDSILDFFDLHRIVFEYYVKDTLVSGLVVFIKSIVFKSRIITFAGIGGVVTDLQSRNKGYATDTLKFMIDYLRKRKVGVALLCTDIERLGNLYKKVGFTPINKKYYFLNLKDELKFEEQGMICQICSKEDFDFILNTKERIFVGRSNF